MGIDFGEKRIGIALSDEDGEFSFPHSVLENSKNVVSKIKKVCQENNVGQIVIGLPLDFRNKPTDATEGAQNLKIRIEEEIKLPVLSVSE